VGNSAIGAFTLDVSPSAVSVNKGGSTSAFISIARSGGFTGEVAVTITGFPGGVFATVAPGSISGGFGIITILVDNTIAAGSYTATVQAQGDNVAPQSASLTVMVIPAIRAEMAGAR
ncbi:MAG: hypothetical protein ABJB74_07975, partial [Gemmatimonas sp.]